MGTNLATALTTFVTLGLAWALAAAEPKNWIFCEGILTAAAALVIRDIRELRPELAPVPSRRQARPDHAPNRSRNIIQFPVERRRVR